VATIDQPLPDRASAAVASALVAEANDLRTFPQIALEVFRLTGLPDPPVKEIEEWIRQDTVLVSRVLRRVNSAYYALRHRVDSVASAIMYLGTRTLRNVVVLDCLNGYFLADEPEGDKSVLSLSRLFEHGAAVGAAAQLIARRLHGVPGEDAFLAGILHDVGLLVEAQVRNAELRRAIEKHVAGGEPLIHCEREALGTDHCEVGRVLADRWLFAQEIRDVVSLHHTPIQDPTGLASLTALVQAADHLAGVSGCPEVEGSVEEPFGVVGDHIRTHAEDYSVLESDFRQNLSRVVSLSRS